MPEITKLYEFLKDKHLPLVGPIISSRDDGDIYFAFITATFKKNGRREPSLVALDRISAEARNLGFDLSFVFVDGERHDIDGSLKTMLFGKFPEAVRNSFVSINNNKADVWIELKRNISDEEQKNIKTTVINFFDLLTMEVKSTNIIQSENIPTSTAILRTLRTLPPCLLSDLEVALKNKQFTVPNETWMNHTMDKLRKEGSIVRRKDGKYFLTLQGLAALGTQKGRLSPDIMRALALSHWKT